MTPGPTFASSLCVSLCKRKCQIEVIRKQKKSSHFPKYIPALFNFLIASSNTYFFKLRFECNLNIFCSTNENTVMQLFICAPITVVSTTLGQLFQLVQLQFIFCNIVNVYALFFVLSWWYFDSSCGFLFYNLYDSYQYILRYKTHFGSSCNIISLLLTLYDFMKYRVMWYKIYRQYAIS